MERVADLLERGVGTVIGDGMHLSGHTIEGGLRNTAGPGLAMHGCVRLHDVDVEWGFTRPCRPACGSASIELS